MKIKITYIHKISPNRELDSYLVDGEHDDLASLDTVRNMLKRNKQTAPKTQDDRLDRMTDSGLPVYVLFPKKGIWHSIIVEPV